MTGPYSDIIHLPHPVSATHPQMSSSNRAAQFSSFAALTGYDAAIKEVARLTDVRLELGEGEIAELDRKLLFLAERIRDNPVATIIYFMPDKKKEGGAYKTVTSAVKKIDEFEQIIILMNGDRIALKDILRIETGSL